jgi:hypothetical protein
MTDKALELARLIVEREKLYADPDSIVTRCAMQNRIVELAQEIVREVEAGKAVGG